MRGGVRQDRVSLLPAYPLLESVPGSAGQDITGTPRGLRHLGVWSTTAHTLCAILLDGSRQEGIHGITSHPLFDRVPGGVRPDITAHHRVGDINRGTLVRVQLDGSEP